MLRVMWAVTCLFGMFGATSLVLATPPRPALKSKASGQKSPLASKQGMGGLPSGSKLSPAVKSAVPLSQIKLKDLTINKSAWKKFRDTDDPPTTTDPAPTPITTESPTPTCPTSAPINDGPTTNPSPSSGVLSRFQWNNGLSVGNGIQAPKQKLMPVSK
jgi:hypothetical protein